MTSKYLVNAGSHINPTNSTVYINFTRHPIVPDTADINIKFRPMGDTNDVWIIYEQSTFAIWKEQGKPPYEFYYENATNYDWIVYSNWTPGPAVVTNGVWHCKWQMSTNRQHIVMINTEIFLDDIPLMTVGDAEAITQEETEKEE